MESIIQWNCNGCKHHYCELKLIMSKIPAFCICLQETHFKPEENFSLRGYNVFRKDAEYDGRAKGGVALFFRNNIPTNEIHLQTELQAIAVQSEFPFKITICNVYLPEFDWDIQDLRQLAAQLPRPYIILGDFNSHNPLWGSKRIDTRGRLVEQFINDEDLVLLNTGEGTYLNSRSNEFSAIDLSLCSPQAAENFNWKRLDDYLPSDHFPLVIECLTPIPQQLTQRKWKLDKADWPGFVNKLNSNVNMDSDIDTVVYEFTNNILSAAAESIPLSNAIRNRPAIPWWNEEVKEAVKKKKNALNIFKRFPNHENMIQFKRLRAKARRLILQSKRASWETYVSSINTETQVAEVWRKVRSINGKHVPYTQPTLLVDNHLISDPSEVSNILATQYHEASSSQNYDPAFLQTKAAREIELTFDENELSPYNDPFSLEELENALRDTGNSSPGPDNIPYEMIRQLPLAQKQNILCIFNYIWQQGQYPDKWREAIIIPILKQGKNPSDPSSYRPISLTCCLSKLLEKMVNTRLVWFLEKKKLLNDHQMGFRKFRSTTDQLVHLENVIQIGFANRHHTVAVFFDLEKAYDMTWRYGILKALHAWGIRGNLPKFIESFLKDRRFHVRIGDKLSDVKILENGIPQGSTLSVTLFSIAINDICKSVDPTVGRSLYVDDLAIYFSHQNMTIIEETLQTAINIITANADACGFRFSVAKTHCTHFCRLRKPHNEPQLQFKDRLLEVKCNAKFLGVTFDSKLTWGPHINNLATKCKKALNIIRCVANINWGANREITLRLYKSLILSKMDYGCIVYSAARKSRLKPLDTIHGIAIRLATGAFRTSPLASLYCESGIPPLHIHRKRLILNYTARIHAQPNHPNYSILFENPQFDIFESRPTITRPLGVRARELLVELDHVFPSVHELNFSDIPPWQIKAPKVHLECARFKKDETNINLYKTTFARTISQYPNSQVIYTDGSKTNQGVGSAFTTVRETHASRLHTIASIYTAELNAIAQALQHAKSFGYNSTVICSDSLSALCAISNTFSMDPLIQKILAITHSIREAGNLTTFIWTPGHIGIRGNELADKEARNAADHGITQNIKIRSDDIKAHLKRLMDEKWQIEWNATESKLKEIKPNIGRWISPIKVSRREGVALTRLRIGHSHLTSSHLLLGTRTPNCSTCHVRLTVKHLLLECEDYANVRQQLQLPQTLSECLKNTTEAVRKMTSFLNMTGLLHKL